VSERTEGGKQVERVKQEVDRWLDAIRNTGERALETMGLTSPSRPSLPAIDVIEFADEILVQIDLPGVSPESVELTIVGNMLNVSANRPATEFASDAKVHVRERTVTKFHRSIALPSAANEEAIRAESRDGLLRVTLCKVTGTPTRTIPVTRGQS
jgi:HSP20 family protein